MGGKKWSEAETMTMRAHFPTLGYNIAALMQRRTHEAVRAKAKELGIKTPEQTKREAMNARLREEVTTKGESLDDYIKRSYGIGLPKMPEYPPQYTSTLAEGIPNKPCAPCGNVRRWVREWSPNIWPIVIGVLLADLFLALEYAFKAFGG